MTASRSSVAPPRHIGFSVDGNRRWAERRGLSTREGHVAGYRVFKEVVFATVERGVSFVSGHLFSTETWKRSQEEVDWLLDLILRPAREDAAEFHERGVAVRYVGRRSRLGDEHLAAIERCEAQAPRQPKGTAVICLDYGGRMELVEAMRRCVEDGLGAQEIDEAAIAARLCAPDVPDVDLMVRTSEQRLSNFMLWRLAFSEVLFLDKLWPELDAADVDAILDDWASRERRFGGDPGRPAGAGARA